MTIVFIARTSSTRCEAHRRSVRVITIESSAVNRSREFCQRRNFDFRNCVQGKWSFRISSQLFTPIQNLSPCTCESHILNIRENPDESRVCVESSEKLETFLRKNLDKHRALCANLASPADGYVPAALSRAKG